MEGQAAGELCRQALEKGLPGFIQGRKQAQVDSFKGKMVVSLRRFV